MASYLKHWSTTCKYTFFVIVWKYIIIFREAFNQFGPEKYKSDDPTQLWEKEYYESLNKRLYSKGFSELASTEYLPDIVNELYVFYQFHFKRMKITLEQVKEITMHFWQWLHDQKMTSAKVLM